MDKLEQYRQCIQTILTKHSHLNNLSRVYHSIMHFDIKNGKVWIQQNATDVDLAQELVEMGMSKEDIVLGLQPPYKRPYTGYGVA